MEDLIQYDVELYGPQGGPREYSEFMGRENGGGFINGPLAFSDFDGKGIWAQPPEADGEKNDGAPSPHMGAVGVAEIFNWVGGLAGDPHAEGGWY